MVSQTGAAYTDVEAELGVTFASSGISEWPLRAAVTAAIDNVCERDFRIRIGVATLGATETDKAIAVKWTADWCRRWRFDNAGSIPNSLAPPVVSRSAPRVPSDETIALIEAKWAATRGPRVQGVPDAADY